MLDELLGRASLREEIEALAEEKERLEAQLAAAEERRKEAVRDRQAADEELNRLEDRIADLEGQVENAGADEWAPEFRDRVRVSRRRMRTLLDRLEGFGFGAEEAYTAMVVETVPEAVREEFGSHSALVDRAKPCLVLTDTFGVTSVALRPPRPPSPFETWDDAFKLEEAWFLPTGTFGFALVRSDVFYYAEYEGDEQTFSESFDSAVRRKHSKGGFSQGRFERRRDDQIEAHVEKAQDVISERDPGELIVVGEPTVIDAFEDTAAVVKSVDTTGNADDPLDAAFESFWSSTLFQL